MKANQTSKGWPILAVNRISRLSRWSVGGIQYLGYDICVKIKESKEFLRALTWCLRHKTNFVGFHRCVYIDRRVLPTDQHDIHPAIIKDPVYEHQEEVSAIWESKGGGFEPFIIQCRRVAQYCSIAEQIWLIHTATLTYSFCGFLVTISQDITRL